MLEHQPAYNIPYFFVFSLEHFRVDIKSCVLPWCEGMYVGYILCIFLHICFPSHAAQEPVLISALLLCNLTYCFNFSFIIHWLLFMFLLRFCGLILKEHLKWRFPQLQKMLVIVWRQSYSHWSHFQKTVIVLTKRFWNSQLEKCMFPTPFIGKK